MTPTVTTTAALPDALTAAPQPSRGRAKSDVFPVLELLAAKYPRLFGAEFLPLKRGVFQDIQERQPDAFERSALKAALAFHTRSTRYLAAVSTGTARHDLDGNAVEAMAPEHIYHALMEVFRRRQARSREDLHPQRVARIVLAMEASGLAPAAYADLVGSNDAAANLALDEARSQAESRAAKHEALQRAFRASGKTAAEFADMYGLDPAEMRRLHADPRTSGG